MKCSQILFGIVTLSVVVLVYLTTSANCNDTSTNKHIRSHNLTMGRRRYKDELLYNETVSERKSENLGIVSKEIRYPPITEEELFSLTYLEVKDNNKGGYVYLKSGGADYRVVYLQLESQKGKGYEFQITIYGYKLGYD